MKKILLLISLVMTLAVASAAEITVPVKKAATLPATCDPANLQTLLFYKTGSSNGLYYCSATNTWTQMTNAAGGGFAVGPGSSTDNAVVRFDGTTGKLVQNSPVTIADTTGAIAGSQSIALSGSTSGALTIKPAATAGSNTITLPAGTTDFSATGGTSQVVKQTTSGGALTVGQLAASDLSNGTSGSGSVALTTSPAFTTPNLGVPSALDATNATGTASGLTAGHVTTNANLTGDVTSVGNATTVGKINGTALSGLATGILKNTTTTGVPSIAVAGDFPTLNQNTTGSAATVTTNANLTGPITSTGNATAVAAQTGTGSTFVMQASPTLTTPNLGTPSALVGTNITGTATGLTAGNVTTNANLTGDVTSTGNATTVGKINGTSLAGLSTGILKNTTTTGVPSIAVAGDFPTLNQSTTGSAATLTTPRAINGVNFDGSAAITVTAAAGTLTGSTLNSGVTASSLTSFGTNPTIGLANGTGLPVSGITASTSTALGVGSIELGNASDTTLSRSSAGVLAVEGTVVPTISSTNTLTNKRVNPRLNSNTSSTTPTPNADTDDVYELTALAAGATFGAPTGTPVDGQRLIVRVKDNGTARSLAFNAIYRFSSDMAAPSTTVLSKTYYLLFVYNAADSKWDNIAQLNNF